MTTELVGRHRSKQNPYKKGGRLYHGRPGQRRDAAMALAARREREKGKKISRESVPKDTLDNCEFYADKSTLYGQCSFPTAAGFIDVMASVPLRPIQRALMHELQNQASVEGVGWGWGSIKKAWKKVKKVAKKVAKSKVIKKLGKILKDPKVVAAMNAASIIFPPAGVAYKAAKTATSLVNKAQKGVLSALKKIEVIKKLAGKGNVKAAALVDIMSKFYAIKKLDIAKKANILLDKVTKGETKSRQNFLRIADLALAGNKLAGNIVELMRHMYVIKKKGGTIGNEELIEVSGWLYNPGYRSPLQALELDTTSPFTYLRHGYYQGSQLLRKRAAKIMSEREAAKTGSQILLERAAA